MIKIIIQIIFIILCFSQCQNVVENTLVSYPNTVDTTKFPNQEYAYIKTYSINRTWDLDSLFGTMIDENLTSNESDIDTHYVFDENVVVGDLWLGELSIYNSKKQKAKTAQPIKKLNRFEIKRLQNILVEDSDGISDYTYCVHKYRDAIVFYDKNDKPIDWINFCFECRESGISFEDENWEKLQQFFIDIGHPIKEDDWYIKKMEHIKNKSSK